MAEFSTKKDSDGILRLVLAGDLNEASLHDLRIWIEETTHTIRHEHATHGPLLVLAELSGIISYHPAAMAYLADFIRNAGHLCSHIATSGESKSVHFAKEVVMRMANRHDIQSCATEDEARAWLLRESSRADADKKD